MTPLAALAAQENAVEAVRGSLHGLWVSFAARTPYLVTALVLVLLFWGVGRVARRVVRLATRRARMARELSELLGAATHALLTILGFLVGAVVVFPDFTPGNLVAGVGITSVAAGFAFRDILQNFFAGILILWRRPFHIGDEIRSGDYEGRVEEITTRSTRIHTYDGERVVIPNTDVYTRAILVRTAYPFRRVRVQVGIGYSESIEAAREAITQAVETTEGVLPEPGPWIYVSELATSSVEITVYFWTGSAQANVLAVTNRVVSRVKAALDASGIEIPYPHHVVVLRREEEAGG